MTTVATTLPFRKNGRGHYVVLVEGLQLTGAEEIARLESRGYKVEASAQRALLSTGPDSYDAKHQLLEGRAYYVPLIPNLTYASFNDRSNENHLSWGMGFGYKRPLAGLQLRLNELFQDLVRDGLEQKLIEELGHYVVTLHEPIKSTGDPEGAGGDILHTRFFGNNSVSLRSAEGRRTFAWHDNGVFGFQVR